VFVGQLIRRNADLATAAVELHQAGELLPSTYVIDLDALYENAVALCGEARRLGLTVLAMTKQFGRNPVAIQTLERAGVESFVAASPRGAREGDLRRAPACRGPVRLGRPSRVTVGRLGQRTVRGLRQPTPQGPP
jgi:predicted amino acid racemase